MAKEDWVNENLRLLSNDLKEGSFGMEEKVVGDKIGDISLKDNEVIGSFIPPPNMKEEIDKDDFPLRWLVQKQRGSKGKEKVIKKCKVTGTYSIRGIERKLIEMI